jgi:hypothetical protein
MGTYVYKTQWIPSAGTAWFYTGTTSGPVTMSIGKYDELDRHPVDSYSDE